jgi:hypothetical protein
MCGRAFVAHSDSHLMIHIQRCTRDVHAAAQSVYGSLGRASACTCVFVYAYCIIYRLPGVL